MDNLRRDFSTPSNNRNLGHDFTAESISPWSYNNAIHKMGQPQKEYAPTRPQYNPDWKMYGAGENLQYNQPSMDQMGPNATIKRIFL